MQPLHRFFATAPLGIERLLAQELFDLGAQDVNEARAGVSFRGDLATAYRVCLWSRLANRILLGLTRFPAETPEALYRGVGSISWAEHLGPDLSFAVDFTTSRSKISHSLFGAQKAKDAIVDQLRAEFGVRPSVRLEQPDVRVNIHLDRDIANLSLDLSGDSLHRRGYRLQGGAAPLKENLAAAVLLRAGWPETVHAGGALIDPMCGSATLPIEAALMAADVAPGLLRQYFGFLRWKQHQATIWRQLLEEAEQRRQQGLQRRLSITGYDIDHQAIKAALHNVERAGLQGLVQVERKALEAVRPGPTTGLVVTNPPYGERLGDMGSLALLYTQLGHVLKTHFIGWRASVLAGNPELGFRLGLHASRRYVLYNGAIECKLLNFEIDPARFFTPREAADGENDLLRKAGTLKEQSAGASMFANRLSKNVQRLGRWARRNGIACYRVYDADLPEYALAIDVYQGEKVWAHVQEYAPPAGIDPAKAESRLIDALATIPKVLEIPSGQIFLKIRRKQKGLNQYEKRAALGHLYPVAEGGLKFLVNFEDYLDTGLFLDHRITRQMIRSLAQGKRFLNLFAYTGSATVYAAAGGAISTTSVDMSRTYLDWAKRNLELNALGAARHELIQSDCLGWLEREAMTRRHGYDLIFLDPPTFSNSKRTDRSFDLQRDHVDLIRDTAKLLATGGLLIFATHNRRFKIAKDHLSDLAVEDISQTTIPADFARNPKIHYCWKINRRLSSSGNRPA
jgi:23S rRNA (guanine2445-N2)-methyltransferase / 23S rRNA (guanine2069-N7)-methyltransferase